MSEGDSKDPVVASLQETLKKVEASLRPAIEEHSQSGEEGLDFLDVKNSLLLSYLIDLVVYVRDGPSKEGMERLTEMKVVLDKMKGLDKKLRYQVDKLLASNTTSKSFAAGGDNPQSQDDPLQYRSNLTSFHDGNEEDDDDSSDGDGSGSEDDGNDDDDDDLAAARAAIASAQSKKKQDRRSEQEDKGDGLYHAPRLTAVPYTYDKEQKAKDQQKRAQRRLRATELAQTLRAQYGEAPEQEDVHGGSDYGKQLAAARRYAERQAEKIEYEESAMVRLTVTRKEKKERKRQMQMEGSNLAAISDLGNLVRETRAFGNDDDGHDGLNELPKEGRSGKSRYDNGKRRREHEAEGNVHRRRGKMGKAKNSFQAALYSTGSSGKGKQKKSRR